MTWRGCTVWANVRQNYGCESRSATRSSHCLTGKLLLPHQSYVTKNLSQGAKSRIAHLMGYPSKAFATQSAIEPEVSLDR
ncbi:MAG: hypothetical protein JGK24_05105 [Microcoleus sp. PH2017_29_MFU_D_A]|uniref:hypothetical protein n=1 Tax=unclassified Microcoleus TaxID=2642155 RepID=UPI001DE5FAE2|nr:MULTISPECIES: hypothetical protein [unclassified Microcoleus]MCC3430486.1 hypothetical protein [Microcoleus sp. PH2017_04_SCI_O_A]MCC3443913.1 hypothetical protein [Microcoleus sp. PH2017_03_ELD_O_A]MCC3468301.1 hypothetical protein [Microcoleus sp. PH2017_06_SFM_O_A]MCC3502510.1 hypothetical protein [Microcoleus sp. PH2017_19_SFW_U_A]MCC3512378.1 hypothetical protein [Microcoleus sp. PH2017_17_BER_D_A]